ncbi:uncharacterized protein LOC123621720 [Lemur catta]|uniref:uncharacterized protein LOC123621720 n=1 Tax=Lemur catta TaxID=9447 RepID=UPI001E2688B0|nr:uncharacterized protein LOC123621720 [Lemur catta]
MTATGRSSPSTEGARGQVLGQALLESESGPLSLGRAACKQREGGPRLGCDPREAQGTFIWALHKPGQCGTRPATDPMPHVKTENDDSLENKGRRWRLNPGARVHRATRPTPASPMCGAPQGGVWCLLSVSHIVSDAPAVTGSPWSSERGVSWVTAESKRCPPIQRSCCGDRVCLWRECGSHACGGFDNSTAYSGSDGEIQALGLSEHVTNPWLTHGEGWPSHVASGSQASPEPRQEEPKGPKGPVDQNVLI